ncbi:hypothetical protein [Bacillus sp. UNC438CL73TsuS30]|uniref:hypothetical protein n=1 Tax=Bacillus sp. UNC438CL73TsuS30 TaxID=1340434 RepID=UPI0018CC54F6|nr:hypothetical protein [Bacillus sp. UNC438CL73TsuS30]
MTAGKQLSKTDNQNKATDLAEMGVTFFQNISNNLIPTAKTALANNNSTTFCTEFSKLLNDQTKEYYQSKPIEGFNNYQISALPTITCSGNNQVVIAFNSTGNTAAKQSSTLKGSIIVTKRTRDGQSPPDPNTFKYQITDSEVKLNKDATYDDSVSYTGKVTLVGNTSLLVYNNANFNSLELDGNSIVNVTNTAIFNTINSMNGITNITVNGDAIFLSGAPRIDKFVGKASICIKGNIYTLDSNGKLQSYNDFTKYFTNTCSNSNADWYIDANNGVSVIY